MLPSQPSQPSLMTGVRLLLPDDPEDSIRPAFLVENHDTGCAGILMLDGSDEYNPGGGGGDDEPLSLFDAKSGWVHGGRCGCFWPLWDEHQVTRIVPSRLRAHADRMVSQGRVGRDMYKLLILKLFLCVSVPKELQLDDDGDAIKNTGGERGA